jgi:uncharacterized phiE125 gp8 family phage protein
MSWGQSNWSRATPPHAVSVLVTPPVLEPVTLLEAKLRAGLDWVAGDPRDGLMTSFIAAARSKVEQDTGLALLTQTRDVSFDAIAGTLTLPALCKPLQAVTSLKYTDAAGAVQTLAPATYVVDLAGARIGLALGDAWPTDLRPFQPYVLRIVSGWASVALLTAAEPMLVHLVGRLVAHYATLGRDLASVDPAALVPLGYEDDIAAYRPVTVA